jgi:DNA glycosylase AlkZ-like
VADRVLSEQELNRALLARQLLLERAKLPLSRVLERICGIQNQYAPNGYVRLWSCVEGFEREDLTKALARRSVVQGTLMRETIHLVSRRDYAPFAGAIRRSGQAWRLRVDKRTDDREVSAVAGRLREELRGRTMSRAELDAFCDGTPGVSHWLNMVRVPPAGTWEQRRAHTYGLAEEWVGPLDIDEDDAIEHLVRRYLTAFGPASRDDVAKFTGIPKTRLKPVLDRTPIRRFVDEEGKELVDVPRGVLPDPETPAPVRFLPTWDATLLVHARRTGVLPERHRARIFNTRAPHSFSTFLVDGRVAGTWRHEHGRVRIEPFERLPRDVRRELDDEAERLAALHE